MKDREELADALYLLRAGADPDTFLRVLRTYVLQHTTTHEQAAELLQALMQANPVVVSDVLQSLPKPKKARKSAKHKSTRTTKATNRASA
jgi:hypothetical protein